MVTTKINIKPHLAEYIQGRFNDCEDSPVTFPHDSDLYVALWDLMAKRPINARIDQGNLEIVLPSRSCGKRPERYNYISTRARDVFQKKIEEIMFEELHHLMRTNKRKGITYLDTVCYFMLTYGISSISEDAFIKGYYRLRRNEYNRKKNDKKNVNQTQ